jgi:aspartyl-tRNA synthetase
MTSDNSSSEEAALLLVQKIITLADQIQSAKAAQQPKSFWESTLQELLAAKAEYKNVTGKDYGPPPSSSSSSSGDKKVKESAAAATTASSDRNRDKNEAKARLKAEKEEKKLQTRMEREAREKAKADKLAGIGESNFGDRPLIQSAFVTEGKQWTLISQLNPSLQDQTVTIRGYLQKAVLAGKIAFCLLRSGLYSVQGVAAESVQNDVTHVMCKYMTSLPLESVVEITGVVTIPHEPILSATQKMIEIRIVSFHCICKVTKPLPFLMEDACRPDSGKETDVGLYNEDDDAVAIAEDGLVHVGQKMRLDYRWLDLRTPANQAIFRIESMVGTLFREYLTQLNFIEIHTPKLISGASEGGSDVFTLNYFGQPACLAMSPQLHKQITAACSGFERVYEVGPVFRAENSNTRRHLCEFTGLDLEMTIHEHYDEVLHVMSEMFIYIFDGINERCSEELERVREQHPFEDLKYLRPTLKLTYAEGCALLRKYGNVDQDEYEDLSTEHEKKLGDIVKMKYGTDFYFMDKYPLSVRPFYTMPCPDNPKLSNSYDFFIRGQEIVSGAQRIHDADLLEAQAMGKGISIADIADYIQSFRHGAMPHGGGGVGLERVVMLLLGLPNIRKTAWFPRDPKRIAP